MPIKLSFVKIFIPVVIVQILATYLEMKFNLPWWSSILIAWGFFFFWFNYCLKSASKRRSNKYYKSRFSKWIRK